MKKPFGRIGGKSQIAKYLITLIPKDIKYFIEPFFGGGSVFFEREKDDNIIEVINDLDKDIYKMLKGLQNRAKYINDNISREIITKSDFEKLKNKNDVISLFEKNKTSFLSRGLNYSSSKANGFIKTDFTIYKPRLKNVIILNEDYREVINKFNFKDSFFYLDPPYEMAINNTGYYKEHSVYPEDLLKIVNTIKGRFMLSYNDSPNIRKLFKKYYIHEINTYYAGSYQNKIELIITNYPIN